MTFGDFVKEKRLGVNLGLRAFAAEIGIDPANYSKIERGKTPAPKDLERIRKALCIDKDSFELRELERLADLSRGQLPRSILTDQELVGKLPAFFRRLDGDPVDDQMLDELIATIKREY